MDTSYSYSSQHFFCPHCKGKNTKSAAIHRLSEASMEDNKIIVLDGLPEFINCDNCGKSIETIRIIEGLYDGDEHGSYADAMPYMLSGILAAILILKFFFAWNIIAAFFVGIFAGCMLGYIAWSITGSLKKLFLFSFLVLFASHSLLSQPKNSYIDFLLNDRSVRWAAEYETIVNLSAKTNTVSLKKWYLERLKKASVKAYQFNHNRTVSDSYMLSIPALSRQEWLEGYKAMPSDEPAGWWFSNPKFSGYYRVLSDKYATDSCCGCDEADVFRIRQLLIYKNAKLQVRNVIVSPLCARKIDEGKAQWYPLGDFAYNTSSTKPSSATFLKTSQVTYNINARDSGSNFTILTPGDADVINQLLKDIKTGKISAYDYQTNKKISPQELLTWRMAIDTMQVMDEKTGRFHIKFIQHQLKPEEDFTHIKITQDWYFNFENERLFSIVKSATLFYKTQLSTLVPFYLLKFK